MNHNGLYQKSIEIIKRNQDPAGSYIASPNFKVYAYSWLRDGSYIAFAMDKVGEHGSARAFHLWVAEVVQRYRSKIAFIRKALEAGHRLKDQDFLFTRYSLAGYEDMTDESWGNFQYDGYGTWLWALWEHYKITSDRQFMTEIWQSVLDVVDYLKLVWRLSSYDCWEEFPEFLHPYSLSCAYAGMMAALAMAEEGDFPIDKKTIKGEVEKIQQFTLKHGIFEGVMVKHIHPGMTQNPTSDLKTDSSFMGVLYPNRLFELDSEVGRGILDEIRFKLISKSGGVYRYKEDTYFGGGTWILLNAWLGWLEAKCGDFERAHSRLDWIADKADARGWLPEQLTDEVLYPEMVEPWVKQRGQVANPLLWSHAMYLILSESLRHKKDEG